MENVFYFKKINSIGGVESVFWYLSCLYKNMVVFYKEGDPEQIKRLAKNIEVIKYNDKMGAIKCKRFFCFENRLNIIQIQAGSYKKQPAYYKLCADHIAL